MAKRKSSASSFNVKEMDAKEAQRLFSKSRSRGSKYDEIIEKASDLGKGKALIAEGLTYSEVTGLRKRVADFLGDGWTISSTKVDKEKSLYDVLMHRSK